MHATDIVSINSHEEHSAETDVSWSVHVHKGGSALLYSLTDYKLSVKKFQLFSEINTTQKPNIIFLGEYI